MSRRLGHSFGELRRVVGRTATDDGAGEQVAGRVTDDGELRPTSATKWLISSPVDVIGTGMAAFETRGVDGGFGALVDQAERASASEDSGQERLKSPFFSRRCSA